MDDTTTTPTPPVVRLPSTSIPGRFAQVVSRHADRVAVSMPGTEWTYAELDRYSGSLACQILDRRGAASEPVALLMEHGAPLIAGILGVLKAGRIYLALDPTDTPTGLAAMLGDASARLLVTDKPNASLAHALAAGRLEVVEIADPASLPSPPTTSVEVPSEAGAWLMYTSGSTSAPKGVWQNHRGVVHQADVYGDLIRITPDDRLSLLTSCSLAASATPLFAALLHGATLCPFHVRSQGVERLAAWLRLQRLSVYHSVPTVFRHLMRSAGGRDPFESLRWIRLGGEPVLRGDVEAYRRQCPSDSVLMHALSSTETGLITTLMINQRTTLQSGRVPVGRAVRDVEVMVVDEKGQPPRDGRCGRIVVRSRYLAQGYWMRPDATAEVFRMDARDPQTRLFVTGDLGRFQPDGCLEHLGRVDQQVKIRGRRVDLAEVEAALQAMDLVEDAVAVAQDDPSGEHRLIAYIVPRAGTPAASRAYRRTLRRSLPDHMIPDEFMPLPRLPTTAGGKVDRLGLPPRPRCPETLARHRPMPRDRIEKTLAALWESVLGVSPIGRRDDFFDLGGTSLQSIEVLARIEERLNVALPPSTLAEHSTIEELAALVAHHAVIPSPKPLVVLRAVTAGRPLFLVHGGPGHVAAYGQLARRLPGRPVYGLQAIGLQAECWPLMSIPAMARRYVQEAMVVDPAGPYLLAGACMGGLIAFEMAQLLVRLGRPVGLVALLDSDYPAPSGRRVCSTERAVALVRDTFRIVRWSIARAGGLERRARWLPAYRHFVAHMNARARRAYWPTFYGGTITLVLSAEARYPGEDRRLMMARYAHETRTVTIPGDRAGLLVRPAVGELARQLQVCLDTVQSGDLDCCAEM